MLKVNKQKRLRMTRTLPSFQPLEPRLFLSTTVLFREGGGTGYTNTTFDDTFFKQSQPDITYGGTTYMDARHDSGYEYDTLIAQKNLFTLLPATNGNGDALTISQAKLHLFAAEIYNSGTVAVYRMTKDWLPNSAGSNENNVDWNKSNVSASTNWTSGAFSSSDYTTTDGVTATWNPGSVGTEVVIDVTNLVNDIYSAGNNYGLVVHATTDGYIAYMSTSEASQAYRPVLEITYDYISATTVSIAATDSSAAEPSDIGMYTVTRTGATTSALTVNYTVSGTATNGTDYTSLSGSVTIPSGAASATITLTPTNDNTVESTETAILTLATGTGYTIGSPSSDTVNIADNDSTITIAATTNAAEPSTNSLFTVTRSGYTGAALTVNFTRSGTATNGTDYSSLGTTVVIASGATTATVPVTVIDDALVEGTETVILTLATGTDYTVGSPNAATVNIVDNDTLVAHTLTVNNGTGDGSYTAGTVVSIAATPATGDAFYVWSSASGTFSNVNNSSTTFTMPDADVTIYANCSLMQTSTQLLREGTGVGYTVVTLDDATITINSDTADNSDRTTMWGTANSLSYTLLGYKDLFTLIPRTFGGNNITVTSAKLHLTSQYGSSSDTIYVDRLLSNWMTGDAGTNEADVTYKHRDKSAGLHWASGGDFSSSDYTTTHQASTTWGGWGTAETIDVTAMMQDIYTNNSNCGFILRAASTTLDKIMASEWGTVSYRPYIEISYTYGLPTPMHTLTVTSGTASDGKGNAPGYFWDGESVSISPNTAPTGKKFNMWIGDVGLYQGVVTTLSEDLMPIAQIDGLTVGGTIEVGDKFIVTVNGHSLTVSATGTTTNQTCINIVNAINASADSEFQKVTASQDGTTTILLTAKAAGTPFTCTVSTTESDNSASDGQTFSRWTYTDNHTPATDNISIASTHYIMPAGSNVALTATYRDQDAPTTCYDWWPRWQPFVTATFGAENEPLAYTAAGGDNTMSLAFEANGEWTRASSVSTVSNSGSAVLGFETNLPTIAYIEYGLTTSYGSTVTLSSQYTYLHQVFINGLSNNTTYHYRIVATDERNNVLTSSDKTLTTSQPAGSVVAVSGGHFTSAYNCNTANTTYVLTGDVTADYGAFVITASGVTLDLGGHTVIYDNVNNQVVSDNFWDYINNGSIGVKAVYQAGVNVYNGTILQGDGCNTNCSSGGLGYNPVFLDGATNGEVAGLYVEYIGAQACGLDFLQGGSTTVHNNVVLDRGGYMIDRHQGVAAITGAASEHHNLVLRARQGGVGAVSDGAVYDNEIYIDSTCTNSSCVGSWGLNNVEIYGNRGFASGYMLSAIGIQGASTNVLVHDNFIHLQAVTPDTRWMEYGAESGMYCFRTTTGGNNITFEDNVVTTYARYGGQIRGAWVYVGAGDNTQDNIENCVYQNNIIQTIVQDDLSICLGSVSYTGDGTTTVYGVTFKNNRLISNSCIVEFGNAYGSGCNGLFVGNTLVKVGSRADFETIKIGYNGITTSGHRFYDSVFEGGASYDSYAFYSSGTRNFSVGWSLHIDTGANATVTIRDAATNAIVFIGTANASGDIDVVDADGNPILLQYLQTATGQTTYSYNIQSVYGGNTYNLNGVIVDALDEVRSL